MSVRAKQNMLRFVIFCVLCLTIAAKPMLKRPNLKTHGRKLDECKNLDNGATDSWGEDCADYTNPASCGQYDDADFNAGAMCCTCGGGNTINTCADHDDIDDPTEPDGEGNGCSWYNINHNDCTYFDNLPVFDSEVMCCACGGGQINCGSLSYDAGGYCECVANAAGSPCACSSGYTEVGNSCDLDQCGVLGYVEYDASASNNRGCATPAACTANANGDACANGALAGNQVTGCSCDCGATGYEGATCATPAACTANANGDACANGALTGDQVTGCSCDCSGVNFHGDSCEIPSITCTSARTDYNANGCCSDPNGAGCVANKDYYDDAVNGCGPCL